MSNTNLKLNVHFTRPYVELKPQCSFLPFFSLEKFSHQIGIRNLSILGILGISCISCILCISTISYSFPKIFFAKKNCLCLFRFWFWPKKETKKSFQCKKIFFGLLKFLCKKVQDTQDTHDT